MLVSDGVNDVITGRRHFLFYYLLDNLNKLVPTANKLKKKKYICMQYMKNRIHYNASYIIIMEFNYSLS